MTQELTVALRIKAFLTEARQALRGLNSDLKESGQVATQTGAQIGAATGTAAAAGIAQVASETKQAQQAMMTWRDFVKQGMGPAMKEFHAQGMDHAAAHTAAIKKLAAEWKAYKESTGPAPAVPRAPAPAVPGAPAPAVPGAPAPSSMSGLSPAQQAMAMRQLPMQITDITTSLASGMPVWMAAVQQGGQIRDSFGGWGNATKALLSVLTPFRLAVGGVAGAIAAAVLAYKQGADEQDAYNRAIIMSGNAAGVTADQLADMARAVDQVQGTQGEAAEVLTQMAASGKVARENLQAFTEAAIAMERAGGQAASETAKQFTELGKDPVKATLKLNESLHYMTAALYDQLKALVRNGEEERAAEVAQTAYARALNERSTALEGKLGTLERAWRGVRDLAKEAWDAMLSIGRADTVDQKIAKQKELVAFLEEEVRRQPRRADTRGQLDTARGFLQRLEQQKQEADANARTAAEAAKVAEEYAKARDANQKYADAALTKQQLLNKKLEEYRRNNDRIRAGGGTISADQVKREERAIYEEVFGKGFDLEAAKAKSALARATLQADLQLLQQTIRDGDAVIEQALKDGNLSIEAAYTARLSQLTTGGEAQRRVYQAELAEVKKALQKAKTDAERAPLQQQQVEIQAKLKLLDSSLAEGARKLGLWKEEQERSLSAISAKIRVDVSALTGTFDRDAVRRQILEGMRGDIEAVGRMSDPAEQQAARDRLNMLADAGVAQAEFNAKLAEAQRLQAQLSTIEGSLQVQHQQGVISQVELEARLRAARAAQVPVLQEILQQLIAIRAAMPPEAAAAIDAMNKSVADLQNQAAAATPVVTELGTRLRNTAIDGLADAAAQAVTNFSNLRQSVATMLKQIAADIVRSGIKQALLDQFNPAKGGGSGGNFLTAAISVGKSLFGFAEGGLIRGPGTGTSDSIPALVGGRRPIAVSDHEFIQPQKAVKHYGLGFMEAVRTLRFPRPGYAFGGLVAAQRRARFATGGSVGASGADQAPQVSIQFVNNGTPQRVVNQSQQVDGKRLVVSVVLDDLARGGPISQAMRAR